MPPATKKAATKKAAAAPVAEVEELETDELEELDEDEVAEAAPTKKAASDEVTFGAADLAALLTKKTGKTITARDLRTLLRKMARDSRLNREIVPGNRARYNWSGPKDPEVVAIIEAVTGGELEAGKQEALAKLKADKADKQAKKAAAKAKAEKAAKKAAVVEEDDEDDDE